MNAVEETVSPGEDAVADVLPILPLKETVVFPDSMTPLAVGQERSIQLVDEAVANDSTIALITTRTAEEEAQSAEDIYSVGTAALIHKMIRVPDGTLRILVQGVRRVHLDRVVQTEPYLVGDFTDLPDVEGRRRRSTRSRGTSRRSSAASSASSPTCPTSSSSQPRTRRIRARSRT